ncbi:MAG: glycosyl transferase group 1 [Actinomycetia bacterium]|nr:glycosyl transferase group 1 [Actinomycetes bacterium]
MRTIIFGTYDTAMHPRIATIAEGLAARGFDVTECNIPLGLTTADRVDMLAKPWKAGGLVARLASRWVGLAARARGLSKHGLGRPDAVVVGYLGHFDVHLARLLYRRGRVPLVLDHLISAANTAKDRRLDGGMKTKVLRLIDAAALRAADIVLVDTEEHLEIVPEKYRSKAVVVHVGAPTPWHEAAREPSATAPSTTGPSTTGPSTTDSGPLKVVFYGLYTPLQGTPVIGEALGRLAGAPVEVTMIGRGQDEAETKRAAAANQSVRWLDWVPAAELPALVAAHDVCLGIFGTGDKALRVVPNKVFQGAAAGCAVITSDTAPQRRVLGTVPQESGAVLVPPGDPAALADALLRLANDREALLKLRHAARRLAADRFTPEQVVGPLTDRLLPPHAPLSQHNRA